MKYRTLPAMISHPTFYHADGRMIPAGDDLRAVARKQHIQLDKLLMLIDRESGTASGWRITPEKQHRFFRTRPGERKTAKREEEHRRQQRQSWAFISPDGVVYDDVRNLTHFARDHAINHGALTRLASGKMQKQNVDGWRVYKEGVTKAGVPFSATEQPSALGIIHTDGTLLYPLPTDLGAFARKYDLNIYELRKMLNGKRCPLNGWRCATLRDVHRLKYPPITI